ncbi:TonB-dependent receptor domain-containing protein [Flocculibacter collagenilyticus]|uniref:TonB-dependent receptor domain-containing protein n=1 Tax=Flocculibacter collagenilyticus TaxID=2744479 RepID=UPI0018F5B5C5|nr:TonB-dependent receptor [Flocculibacter collagenilyticus]
MIYKTKVSKAVQFALLAGSMTLPAFSALAAEESTEGQEIERVEVTGSRIARAELSQPTPVISLDEQDIAKFGLTDLGSLLSELPAIGATDTLVGNNNSNAFAGISSPDLRRLGSNRTLVLVNGKRHVAGVPGSAQVDLTTIPTSLIKRVEVITGGASAIYGSDAVSGVVNVILKDDYEGFELNVSGTSSTEGVGSRNHGITFLAGADLSNGKGNVTFFAGIERTKEVMSEDIRQFDGWGTVANPDSQGEEDGIPDRLRVPRVYSEMINAYGVLNPFGGGAGRYTFDNDGNPFVQVERDQSNSFAFGSFPNGCDSCFNTEDYENFLPGIERISVGSSFNYQLTDNLTFVSDFKYARSDIEQQYQPSFRFGNISVNVEDNAFLDDSLREVLLDAGQTNVTMAKFFDELGNRSADNRRELFRYTAALEGDFTLSETDFDYEVYYVYGETRNRRKTLNDLLPGNFTAALDSVIDPETGEAACRSQVASAQGEDYTDPASVNGGDCVAYNPFGFGQASEAARDWVSADVTRQDRISQEIIGASFVTDTSEFFDLQGGPIAIAAGFEYREEESEITTDEFTKAGFLTSAATPDEFGAYDVTESYIEISLPLFAGLTGIEELTLDAAYRTADYSHAGETDAWKIGLMYAPIDDFRIRGTYGQAVRAPNISEAFSPLSPGFARVSDPCDADNIPDDPDRAANCKALGMPDGFEANDNVSVDTLSGGNSELNPEESTSLTAGIVWTPSFIEDFSITLDYYDIEIEDAIIEVAAQDIADNCVDATGGPDAGYCSQIDRNANFDIELVRSGYLNASAYTTRGLELQVLHTMPMQVMDYAGEFKVNFLANKLLELEQFEFQDRPDEINVEEGEVGDPKLQLRLSADYKIDQLAFGWTTRYIDRVVTYDVSPGGGSPEDLNPGHIGSITTHDLSMNYELNDNASFNMGIRNVFDKLPPGYVTNAMYDLMGRKVYAGVKISL